MAMGDFIDKCTNHVEGEPILYADGDLRGGGLKADYPFVEEDILPLQVSCLLLLLPSVTVCRAGAAGQ